MRRRALALSIVSSAAVLAVGYQVGVQTHAGEVAVADAAAAGDAAAGDDGSGDAAAAGTAAGASGTYTGDVESTRFGDVQVQVTVENGSITDVLALRLTDKEQRSVSISNRAAPVLRGEVLAAQSAEVQNVSGATYTSDAYLSSLQSALDQAGL